MDAIFYGYFGYIVVGGVWAVLITAFIVRTINQYRKIDTLEWGCLGALFALFGLPLVDATPNFLRFAYHCSQLAPISVVEKIEPQEVMQSSYDIRFGCNGACDGLLATEYFEVEAFSGPIEVDAHEAARVYDEGWHQLFLVAKDERRCGDRGLDVVIADSGTIHCIGSRKIDAPSALYLHKQETNDLSWATLFQPWRLPFPYFLTVRQDRLIDKSTNEIVAHVSKIEFGGGLLLRPFVPFSSGDEEDITCADLSDAWAYKGTENFVRTVVMAPKDSSQTH